MIARLPVKLSRFPDDATRGPTGRILSVGTVEAEFEEVEPSDDPTGLLPSGVATVGSLAEPVLDAAEEAGYHADDYEIAVDDPHRTVLWAVVEDDPRDADGDEWVRFEEVDEEG